MTSFLNCCRFAASAGGTADWTYSNAVTGYQSPTSAGATNNALYKYRAESADLTQWEEGYGLSNTGGTFILTRSVVLCNSSGTGTDTGQTGAGTKINFLAAPQVAVVALADDIGGLSNRRLAKAAAYTVGQVDSGRTIALSGASYYALTFSAPSGYDANHINMVLNEDSTRAKLLLLVYTTSATSITIATGAKAFTVAAGLYFSAAAVQRFRVFSLANSANWMSGTAVYSGTTLTLTVDAIGGTGTFTDWQIAPEVYLWPLTTVTVFAQNNIWRLNPTVPMWNPDAPTVTLNVDPTNGLDCNDGMAAGAGNAVKHIQRAIDLGHAYFQAGRNSAGGPYNFIIDCASLSIQEQVTAVYKMERSNGFSIQNIRWVPANSGYCLLVGDGAYVAFGSGVTFGGSSATTPTNYVVSHGDGICDFNTPTCESGGLTGSMFVGDGAFRWNFYGGMTINSSGGAFQRYVFEGVPGSDWNIQGAFVLTGTPAGGRFARARGANMHFTGTCTYTGAHAISVMLVNQLGIVLNEGAALPGGAPTPTTGGQYNTNEFT